MAEYEWKTPGMEAWMDVPDVDSGVEINLSHDGQKFILRRKPTTNPVRFYDRDATNDILARWKTDTGRYPKGQ